MRAKQGRGRIIMMRKGLVLAGGYTQNGHSDHRQRKPRVNSGERFFPSMEERNFIGNDNYKLAVRS